MFPLKFSMTNESLTVFFGSGAQTIKKGAKNWDAALEAFYKKDVETLEVLMSPGIIISRWSQGNFVFADGALSYKGDELPEEMHARILRCATDGGNPTALMNFWERLKQNPSKRSVDQLFDFISRHMHVPICEDGSFLAYKGVKEDYYDAHSGTFRNTPGAKFVMPRNKISDDPRAACAEGFHVGALTYARSFSARLMICKVGPEDVVSVPYDSSSQKIRVCRYEVLGHYGGELPSTTVGAAWYPEGADKIAVSATAQPPVPVDDEPIIKPSPEPDPVLEPEDDEDAEPEDLGAKEEDKIVHEGDGDVEKRKEMLQMTLEELRAHAKAAGVKNVKAIAGGKIGLLRRLGFETGDIEVPVKAKGGVQLRSPAPPKVKPLEELEKMKREELRKYAWQELKIVGAHDMPKPKLLEAIQQLGLKDKKGKK